MRTAVLERTANGRLPLGTRAAAQNVTKRARASHHLLTHTHESSLSSKLLSRPALSPCHTHSLERGLTDGRRLALSHRLHYANDTTGLQGRLEPVGGIFHISHINAQAAIFTQQDHGCPLLFVAGCVPDGNHVLDLEDGTMAGVSVQTVYLSEPQERKVTS